MLQASMAILTVSVAYTSLNAVVSLKGFLCPVVMTSTLQLLFGSRRRVLPFQRLGSCGVQCGKAKTTMTTKSMVKMGLAKLRTATRTWNYEGRGAFCHPAMIAMIITLPLEFESSPEIGIRPHKEQCHRTDCGPDRQDPRS